MSNSVGPPARKLSRRPPLVNHRQESLPRRRSRKNQRNNRKELPLEAGQEQRPSPRIPNQLQHRGRIGPFFHQSPLSRDYRRCNPSLLIRSHRLRRNWLQRSSNRRLNRRGLGASHKKNNLLNILKVGPSMRRTRKRLVKLTVQSRRKKSFRRHLSLGLLVTKPAMKLLPLP